MRGECLTPAKARAVRKFDHHRVVVVNAVVVVVVVVAALVIDHGCRR